MTKFESLPTFECQKCEKSISVWKLSLKMVKQVILWVKVSVFSNFATLNGGFSIIFEKISDFRPFVA